jgi:hypothetical protein
MALGQKGVDMIRILQDQGKSPEKEMRYGVYSIQGAIDSGQSFTRSFIVLRNGYGMITRFTRLEQFMPFYQYKTYKPIDSDPGSKKGHEWRTSIYDRRKGTGCPICANDINRHTIIPGKNDLASNYPDLVEEWDYERNAGITPESIAAKSNRKVWWICKNGHHWRATPLGRSTGSGCPICVGKRPVISRLI